MMRSLVLLAVLLLPAASAAPVTLYAHVDGNSDMRLDTQLPDAAGKAPGLPLLGVSGCVTDPTGQQGFTDRSYNTWYAIGTQGLYNYINKYGEAGVGFYRGLTGDVVLDEAVQPILTWYVGTGAADRGAPIIPNVVLKATLREGDQLSVGNKAYNEGAIVAQGRSTPVTLSPMVNDPQVTHHMVDGEHVYGFTVPLTIEQTTIDGAEGYNLRVDAYMDNPVCTEARSAAGGDYLALGLRPHQSPGLFNQLSLGAMDPLSLEAIHVQQIQQDVIIHVKPHSAFGYDDVLTQDWMRFTGKTPVGERYVAPIMHTHSGDTPPSFSYIWNTTATKHGVYPFEIHFSNVQQTANITIPGELRLDDDGPKVCFDTGCWAPATENSTVPSLPVLALLGVLGLLARRRG